MEITNENISEFLNSEKPTLLYFTAPWCGPCRMLKPIINKIIENNNEQYNIGIVNVDEQNSIAEDYCIMSIPSLFWIKNGAVIYNEVGLKQEDYILDKLNSL